MWRHRSLAVIAASLILITSQAWGQQSIHRVGVLGSTEVPELIQTFLDGLREGGYVLGRDLQIDYRYFKADASGAPAQPYRAVDTIETLLRLGEISKEAASAADKFREVSNMQWQTIRAARAKDRWELKACAR
jgi:hypothetical protein